MKFAIGILATAITLYLDNLYARPAGAPRLSLIETGGVALLLIAPIAGACRLWTRRFPTVYARIIDLGVVFGVCGIFWALALVFKGAPQNRSPIRFWFAATQISWRLTFLPYVLAVGLIEWIQDIQSRHIQN